MKLYLNTLIANNYTVAYNDEENTLELTRNEGEPIEPRITKVINKFPISRAQASIIIADTANAIDQAITINDITLACLPLADDETTATL